MPLPLQCQCPGCKLPFAEIVGDALVVVSRHHGKRHPNKVPLAALKEAIRIHESLARAQN